MKKNRGWAKFFRGDAYASAALGLCLLTALILANVESTSAHYFAAIDWHVGASSLQHWVNDGLMAIFFYVVGMEIKRELISGSLSSVKKAVLPLFAAVGGMVLPALLFSIVNHEPRANTAWGIPMATDIAFAVGALIVAGRRAPVQMRALLLALAVIDDLGAILVIALFYSNGVKAVYLLAFAACALLAWFSNRKTYNPYVHHALGVVGWGLMLSSGIHATLAGVIWGFLTPDDASDHAPLDRTVHALHPYVNFGVLPLFAVVNSGIRLPSAQSLPSLLDSSVLWAVAIGLGFGKPIGIVVASWACVTAGMAALPRGIRWAHVVALGLIAGIGFTMSLFIAQLSLGDDAALVNSAKIGILLGSLSAGLAGIGVLFARKVDG